MKRNIQEEVTAKILAKLEAGVVPWVKPWSSTAGGNMPCNATTNRLYSGVNTVILWQACEENAWPTMRFLTFNQAKACGGNVKKGEKSKCFIVFFKPLKVKDKKTNEDKKVLLLRSWAVFNVAQCENLPESVMVGRKMRIRNKDARDPLADYYIKHTGADFREGHGQAFYVPSQDFVSMPAFEAFKSADTFYNTSFHELTHWTAAKGRCERSLKNRFGEKEYAAEELVAELGAAFQCAEFGFDGETQSAEYIGHWIKMLKDDDKAFFTAASMAQKAVDWLRAKALEEEPKPSSNEASDEMETEFAVAA